MQLIINTYGTYVHVKDQMFEVKKRRDKEIEKHLYSAQKVSNIILSLGTALSSDAVKLAMEHNVDILFVENHGYPIGRVWHSKHGSTSKIRKAQLQASIDKKGLNIIKEWIGRKMENQEKFLRELKKHRPALSDFLNEKIASVKKLRESVSLLEGKAISDVDEVIRGLEGTAGRLYFEALSGSLPDEYRFDGRSSRPAQDPFNAFLNYAYGILYGKIEKALIIAGLDPYLGYLHRDDYNHLSFVFDFIEPYRIFAEKPVFRLFSGKKTAQKHTDELTNGYSLNEFGKPLLIEAFTKHNEEEKINYKGRRLTRTHIIQLDAHEYANSLIK
jgi:CRISP-associated protein Cas1